MHRINLRGPWKAFVPTSEHPESWGYYALERTFNSPSNLGDDISHVFLCLELQRPATQIVLNDFNLLNVASGTETEPRMNVALRPSERLMERYDIRTILKRHNRLTVHWSPAKDKSSSGLPQPSLIRLMPEAANPWLADAWLEIIEISFSE